MQEKFAHHPGEALYLIGFSRSIEAGKKTAANLMCRQRYPLPLTRLVGKNVVLARDIEAAILAATNVDFPPILKSSRRAGRPRCVIERRLKQLQTAKQESPRSSLPGSYAAPATEEAV